MVRTMVSCICSLKTIEWELLPHDIPMIYLFLLVETPSLSNRFFHLLVVTACQAKRVRCPWQGSDASWMDGNPYIYIYNCIWILRIEVYIYIYLSKNRMGHISYTYGCVYIVYIHLIYGYVWLPSNTQLILWSGKYASIFTLQCFMFSHFTKYLSTVYKWAVFKNHCHPYLRCIRLMEFQVHGSVHTTETR